MTRAGFAVLALSLAGTGACAPTREQVMAKNVAVVRTEAAPDRLQARGEAAAAIGDYTRAEQYFVSALRAGGDERFLTTRLLLVCVADGRYPAAESYGEDYLRRHPADTEVHYALATVYMARGELAEARMALEQVIADRPDLADPHYALATVLRDEGGAVLDADQQFREYIRLDPKGPYAEAARASLLKSVP